MFYQTDGPRRSKTSVSMEIPDVRRRNSVPSLWHVWWKVILFVIAPISLLATLTVLRPRFNSDKWQCLPDDTMSTPFTERYYNPFRINSLLDINIAAGSLTFSEAKLIDVFWDIVVARGGQLLLVTIMFPTITRLLTSLITCRTASLDVYMSNCFAPGTGQSLWFQIGDLFSRAEYQGSGRRRSAATRTAILFYWTIYLFSIPSILSAVTGYKAVSRAVIQAPSINGQGTDYVAATDLKPVVAVINDGSRIGLFDDYPVPLTDEDDWWDEGTREVYTGSVNSGALSDSVQYYFEDAEYSFRLSPDRNCSKEQPINRTQSASVPDTPCPCGSLCLCEQHYNPSIGGLCLDTRIISPVPGLRMNERPPMASMMPQNRSSTFEVPVGNQGWTKNVSLEAPTLGITIYRWSSSGTYNEQLPWTANNRTMSASWIREHSLCQPTKSYQWGFSALGALVFLCMTLCFGLTLGCDAAIDRNGGCRHRNTDQYRAILDVGHVLQQHLGKDCTYLDCDQLQNELRKRPRAMVKMQHFDDLNDEETVEMQVTCNGKERLLAEETGRVNTDHT